MQLVLKEYFVFYVGLNLRLYRPILLFYTSNGRTVFVSNRKHGSVCCITFWKRVSGIVRQARTVCLAQCR